MVVVFSSGWVLRTTAQRVLRRPSAGEAAWPIARRNSSMQQATDLPDPTGPRSPRTKADEAKKSATTAPSAEYSKTATRHHPKGSIQLPTAFGILVVTRG